MLQRKDNVPGGKSYLTTQPQNEPEPTQTLVALGKSDGQATHTENANCAAEWSEAKTARESSCRRQAYPRINVGSDVRR